MRFPRRIRKAEELIVHVRIISPKAMAPARSTILRVSGGNKPLMQRGIWYGCPSGTRVAMFHNEHSDLIMRCGIEGMIGLLGVGA